MKLIHYKRLNKLEIAYNDQPPDLDHSQEITFLGLFFVGRYCACSNELVFIRRAGWLSNCFSYSARSQMIKTFSIRLLGFLTFVADNFIDVVHNLIEIVHLVFNRLQYLRHIPVFSLQKLIPATSRAKFGTFTCIRCCILGIFI